MDIELVYYSLVKETLHEKLPIFLPVINILFSAALYAAEKPLKRDSKIFIEKMEEGLDGFIVAEMVK